MFILSIPSSLVIDNSTMLLSNTFYILEGPFQGNVNLPPFIFVPLGIHSTNFPLKILSSLVHLSILCVVVEYANKFHPI